MKRLRKYGAIYRISLQNGVTYRGNLLGSVLFYVLILFVFSSLWAAIYKGGEVPGLTYTQMVWYLCFTELITLGGMRGTFQQMSEDVKSGSIAYQIGRPYHYLAYQYSQSLGTATLSLCVFTAVAIGMGFAYVGPIPGFRLITLPPILLSFALGITLNFYLQMALGLSAFWIEENRGVYFVFNKFVFMMGTFIPVEFLPSWLQVIAQSLPFSYVTWAPARLAVNFSWQLSAQLLPMQVFWTLVMIALCLFIYNRGVRNLETNGG